MMVAMMLPSLAPALWRYLRAVRSTDETRKACLIMLAGVNFAWTLLGITIYPLGSRLRWSRYSVRCWRAQFVSPLAIASVVVMIAAAVQFTSLKAHHLGWCREAPGRGLVLSADARTILRFGLACGTHCVYCCAALQQCNLPTGYGFARYDSFYGCHVP
jgi:predicted metal-binding membrane protein